jgi:hypothetical protein
MGVMPNNGLLPPLPYPISLAQAVTLKMEDKLRHHDELIHNLIQSQQYIILMMLVIILTSAICLISNIS